MGRKPSMRRLHAFQNAVKTLKQFGFVDYDLRKNLTKSQHNRVTKLINEHSDIIRHPEEYVKRNVSKKTKQNWEAQGFPANKKYLIIPKQGYENIHVEQDRMIRRNFNKREVTYAATGKNLHDQLEKVTKRALRPHEYITIRIGDSSPFNTRFDSMKDLLNYISKWEPKDKGVVKSDVIKQFNVVRFYDYEELLNYGEFDEDESEEE